MCRYLIRKWSYICLCMCMCIHISVCIISSKQSRHVTYSIYTYVLSTWLYMCTYTYMHAYIHISMRNQLQTVKIHHTVARLICIHIYTSFQEWWQDHKGMDSEWKLQGIHTKERQYLPTSMLKCIPNTASQLRTNTSTQNKHSKKKMRKKWVGQYRLAKTRRIP